MFVNIACLGVCVPGRLIRIDSTSAGHMAHCSCGWRALPRVHRESAQAAADRHRAEAHPRQAQFVASQRRRRAMTGGR